jgi:transketolase
VLGDKPRVAVEAGIAQPWYEWLGPKGRFVGLSDFGGSAPAPQLYKHFGLTAAAVAEAARGFVKK